MPRNDIDPCDPAAPAVVRLGHHAIALAELVAEIGCPRLDEMMRSLMLEIGKVIAAELVRDEGRSTEH